MYVIIHRVNGIFCQRQCYRKGGKVSRKHYVKSLSNFTLVFLGFLSVFCRDYVKSVLWKNLSGWLSLHCFFLSTVTHKFCLIVLKTQTSRNIFQHLFPINIVSSAFRIPGVQDGKRGDFIVDFGVGTQVWRWLEIVSRKVKTGFPERVTRLVIHEWVVHKIITEIFPPRRVTSRRTVKVTTISHNCTARAKQVPP